MASEAVASEAVVLLVAGNYNYMKKLILIFILLASCNPKKDKQPIANYNYEFLPENNEQFIINDYSNLFTKSQKDSLTKKLYDYEEKTTNQIVVVTTDAISPYTDTQKYASDIGAYWGVGQKEKDNGLVIVLSEKLRKVAIATSYGTEKIVTDSICSTIINRTMIPYFKNDKYYQGINESINSIITSWDKQ